MKVLIGITLAICFSTPSFADWGIDFSKRQKDLIEIEKQQQVFKEEKKSILDMVTDRQESMQDFVIINTAKGLLPEKINIKRGQRYRVHIVNVNSDKKNLSFMLDAFSQHHGTYFGDPVVFEIEPRKEGIFDFQCPETGQKGQFVVYASDSPLESPLESIKLRRPASE